MRIPKIYLETTMFNFYFADDAPEKRQDTLRRLRNFREGYKKVGIYSPAEVIDDDRLS